MHFCSICYKELPDKAKHCTDRTCRNLKGDVCDLVLLPMEKRLQQLYGKHQINNESIYVIHIIERHDHFKYPFKRNQSDTHLRDLHDGSAFKGLMSEGEFLSVPEHTGLILSTDRVPIFKSSKGSLWPIYLMVTSIPPHQRCKMDNLIVASLWFGPTKPQMQSMLHPILNSINFLNTNGIEVNVASSQKVCIKVKLLMGVFDLPAKAAVTNTKQYNGEYGCFYCLDKGSYHNGARTYPPNDRHILRSSSDMTKWAIEAEQTNVSQYGVKGVSVLSEYIEFPQCIPIDYLHSVLEGVFKQLMKLWFTPTYHSEPYSLRKHIKNINKLVCRVKPPKELQRAPRSIDNLSFFKASEYRAWLLFYGLPILSVFLPPDYVHHLSLLVSSMHILLSDEIDTSELEIAYSMLSTFYKVAGDLHSPSIHTVNLHSMEHLVSIVELWGPLWCLDLKVLMDI